MRCAASWAWRGCGTAAPAYQASTPAKPQRRPLHRRPRDGDGLGDGLRRRAAGGGAGARGWRRGGRVGRCRRRGWACQGAPVFVCVCVCGRRGVCPSSGWGVVVRGCGGVGEGKGRAARAHIGHRDGVGGKRGGGRLFRTLTLGVRSPVGVGPAQRPRRRHRPPPRRWRRPGGRCRPCFFFFLIRMKKTGRD